MKLFCTAAFQWPLGYPGLKGPPGSGRIFLPHLIYLSLWILTPDTYWFFLLLEHTKLISTLEFFYLESPLFGTFFLYITKISYSSVRPHLTWPSAQKGRLWNLIPLPSPISSKSLSLLAIFLFIHLFTCLSVCLPPKNVHCTRVRHLFAWFRELGIVMNNAWHVVSTQLCLLLFILVNLRLLLTLKSDFPPSKALGSEERGPETELSPSCPQPPQPT